MVENEIGTKYVQKNYKIREMVENEIGTNYLPTS